MSTHPLQVGGKFNSLADFYGEFVPTYKSAVYRPLFVSIIWSPHYSPQIRRINEKRALSRISSYVDTFEMDRVRKKLGTKEGASIRFGVEKVGTGYHGERGDFCLVGGYAEKSGKGGLGVLHLFYRSLELIGGLGYDICLIDHVGNELGLKWKTVTISAVSANIFALKGNSNEKLYPKLKDILS